MARTETVSARVDHDVKANAEAVFEAIGVPPSIAINMFYKQVIAHQGLPFAARIMTKPNPVSIDDMTAQELDAMLMQRYQQAKDGKTTPFDEFAAEFRQQYDL